MKYMKHKYSVVKVNRAQPQKVAKCFGAMIKQFPNGTGDRHRSFPGGTMKDSSNIFLPQESLDPSMQEFGSEKKAGFWDLQTTSDLRSHVWPNR